MVRRDIIIPRVAIMTKFESVRVFIALCELFRAISTRLAIVIGSFIKRELSKSIILISIINVEKQADSIQPNAIRFLSFISNYLVITLHNMRVQHYNHCSKCLIPLS